MTTVAIVGTGRMGAAMAHALARSGARLILSNRTRERAEEVARAVGGSVASTPAAAAAGADVTITMLANDEAVEAVYRGPDGLLAGARSGAVLVDMSTIRPETIVGLGPEARDRGVGILDSPVSGSVQLAEAGGLTLMVGGEAADLERARPALEPLARTIYHLGELGTGSAMKLAVNTLVFGLNGAVAEGLVLAESAGIDRALAYDVFTASVAGAPFLAYKRPVFLEPDGAPVAFALELAEKDLRLIIGYAAGMGLTMPQASTNLAVIREASVAAGPGRDFATVAELLRSRVAKRPEVP